MNHTKKAVALVLAALLLLPLAGCLVPKDGSSSAPTGAPSEQTAAPAQSPSGEEPEPDFDPEAAAIELGGTIITAGEIDTIFEQYVSMYSYGYDLDREALENYMRMAEEYLLQYYLPVWKAEQLGIALTDEEEAACVAAAEADVAEEREYVICMFAEDYYEGDEPLTDSSVLTEEQLASALADIDGALTEMYGSPFTFDEYLDIRYADALTAERSDRLTVLLKERVQNDAALDDAAVDAWYQTTLDAQKTKYDATPAEFFYDAEDPDLLTLYVPEGYARVQVLEYIPEGEPDEKIASNQSAMKTLEAEYGALVLRGENEARQEEIRTEYVALQSETEALENAYYGAVRASAVEAYAKLSEGAAFESLMVNGTDERLVYLNGPDTHNSDIADIAKTLEPGAYCEPTLADGSYVIVKLAKLLPAGVVDRASLESQIRAAALAERNEQAWDEQFDAWLEEAKSVAVYHRDAYESLIDLYAQSYTY